VLTLQQTPVVDTAGTAILHSDVAGTGLTNVNVAPPSGYMMHQSHLPYDAFQYRWMWLNSAVTSCCKLLISRDTAIVIAYILYVSVLLDGIAYISILKYQINVWIGEKKLPVYLQNFYWIDLIQNNLVIVTCSTLTSGSILDSVCGENSEPCVIWTITNLFNNNYSSKISLASYFIIYILLFIYYFILSINVLLICLDYT